MEQTIFYLFSAIMLGAALRVITAKNAVHAVLSLVLTFFTAGALWLFMRAEFLAIALVVVYVGAVMVLFLFVVMMVDVNADKLREDFRRAVPLAMGVGAVIVIEMVVIIGRLASAPLPEKALVGKDAGMANALGMPLSNTKGLGELIFTDYLLPFEAAGMILLVAMVAAIAITMDRSKTQRRQVPGDQVQTRRADRLQIVKMPAVLD